MRIFLCVFFILLNAFISFKAPFLYAKKKLCIILGLNLALSPILYLLSAVFVGVLIKYFKITNLVDFYKSNFTTCLMLSLLILSFLNLFTLIIVDNLVDFLVGFHQKNNVSNLNENPVKFLIENKEKVKHYSRIFFFLASIIIFYAVWFKTE